MEGFVHGQLTHRHPLDEVEVLRVGSAADQEEVVGAISDGIPCHGADGPREERFQGGLEPTRQPGLERG